jgi:hypothetical protein
MHIHAQAFVLLLQTEGLEVIHRLQHSEDIGSPHAGTAFISMKALAIGGLLEDATTGVGV